MFSLFCASNMSQICNLFRFNPSLLYSAAGLIETYPENTVDIPLQCLLAAKDRLQESHSIQGLQAIRDQNNKQERPFTALEYIVSQLRY
jgi:hypothetical protein